MLTNASGIYAILNLKNHKHYVGSAVNLRKRKGVHLAELRAGRHHCSKLQNAWNKYGESAFRFDVLEIVEDKERLIEREQFYIDATLPFYNSARIAGSSLGRVTSSETRKKISEALTGGSRVFSDEHRKNISEATVGKKKQPLSDERKKQISKEQKARWTDEEREKYRQLGAKQFLGKAHTSETKQAIRQVKEVYRYAITSPDGQKFEATSMRQFCAEHTELHACAMLRVAHGKQSNHKGWMVTMEEIKEQEKT